MLAMIVAVATNSGPSACHGVAFPWCDYTLPLDRRVELIVANLTKQEKAGLFVNAAAGVPRIQWPAYNWWSEALHGVARSGLATSFPQICGVAASHNRTLWKLIGEATALEGRGKNNDRTDGRIYHGLTFWAPNVNIFRDPRWGKFFTRTHTRRRAAIVHQRVGDGEDSNPGLSRLR